MRIGIDARFVGPQGTGLGKYTEKLILNLAKIDKKNDYSIFLRGENWSFFKLPKNFKKVLADIKWYSLEEQLKLSGIFLKEKLDLVHIPHFNVPLLYKGRFVVTIHDLIHHQFSEQATSTRNFLTFKLKRAAYKTIIYFAVKRAAKIIVPSNFVKKQIIDTFKINSDRIIVTCEAAEEEYFGQTQNSRKMLKIKTPYIIYVGNAYPHKNLEKLLDAFKLLTTNYLLSTPHLVLVCPRDVFARRLKDQIKSRDLQDKVKTVGYLEAVDLSSLFQNAETYVFPSLSEGFGIPGLNAMAANIPVVCSNIPTLREIYQDAALYFDPNDPKDIAIKINEVLTDKKTRTVLVEKGKEQVKKYSWQIMAKETLRVYESIFK